MEYGITKDGETLIGLSLDKITAKYIVEQLNELAEENEQFKKLLECSRKEANDYCEELMCKDEFIRLYKRQRDEFIGENEQLKQKLELYGEIYPTGKWITKLNSEELKKELEE